MGVVMAIKDQYDTFDMRTTAASPLTKAATRHRARPPNFGPQAGESR
jgi:Asp-tRNA(Asn)/Glu-tRNA(Gln) amidotransferase A subunit family amidase